MNSSDEGFDWSVIIAIGGTLLGIFLGSILTNRNQEKYIKIKTSIENKKERINNLKKIVWSVLGTIREFDFKIMILVDTGDPITEKGLVKLHKELSLVMKKLEILDTQYQSIINTKNQYEEKLFLKLGKLKELFLDTIEIYLKNEMTRNENKKQSEYKNDGKINDIMSEIKILLHKIVQSEESEINLLQ